MKKTSIAALAVCALLSKNAIGQTTNSNTVTTETSTNNYKKTFINLTMGSNLSYGVLGGFISQHGLGLYIDYRGQGGLLGYQSSQYTLSNNKVAYAGKNNNETYSYTYNKNLSTISQQVNVGVTLHLFGDIKKVSGTLLLGTGITTVQHMYQYTIYDAQGNLLGTIAVKDKDNRTLNANLETMFLLNIKWFNIHAGYQLVAPTFSQSAVVFGVGCSF